MVAFAVGSGLTILAAVMVAIASPLGGDHIVENHAQEARLVHTQAVDGIVDIAGGGVILTDYQHGSVHQICQSLGIGEHTHGGRVHDDVVKDLKLLDVITLGKAQAINLGVDYDRTVRRLLLGVVLCIAIATAMVGPISFLGLIIANLARQMLRTHKHAHLITGAALVGMIAMIAGQLISQHIFSYAVPISTFITIGGGIYFLYLLLFQKGGI